MNCDYCGERLTTANTSPASESEGMCQECHTDKVNTVGW